MDFLDPAKKRAHKIRLFVGYFLIAVMIGLGSLILIFQSRGYDLNRKTGDIIQNGLVFVSAQPQQASIYLNNKLYKTNSGARLVLPSDIYKLELKRDGYRPWQRTFSLVGGTIERFVYPFLFPVNLNTADEQVYPTTPQLATQSPDRHWILVQKPGQTTIFDVYDANDPKKAPTAITIPADIETAPSTGSLTAVEWSTDNKHVLLRHDFSGGSEFLLIDRDTPANSFNINKTFLVNPTKVSLRDKSYDRYYFYDATTQKLSTAELKDKLVTPIVESVLDFKSYGNDVLLFATTQKAAPGMTRVMVKDGSGNYLLREVAASDVYLLDVAKFDGDWYMMAGSKAENKVYVYLNAWDALKHQTSNPLRIVAVLRAEQPTYAAFSENARFMVAEGGSKFAVYDAESKRNFRYELALPLDGGMHAYWMDGHRMYITSGGKLVVFDYDGINVQTLTANNPGFKVFFDRDYRRLYTVSPSVSTPGQFALTKTDLDLSLVK